MAGYIIYRSGVAVGSSATTSYVDSGLSASTTYLYTVAAFDTAGNTSAQSSQVGLTTSSQSYAAAFPLHVQAGTRYPIDANGCPFLLQGDSAWSLEVMPTPSQVARYLDERQSQGFNTILFELIEHKFATNAPENWNGDAPFTGRISNANGSQCVDGLTGANSDCWDFSKPNEAYWQNVDSVVQAAAARGFLVLLFPAYLGYGGGAEGWYQDMLANGPTVLQQYGAYVANRYKSYDNVIWVEGGDYVPPGTSLMDAVASGIDSVIPDALQTGHAVRGTAALDAWSGASWLNINTLYTSYVVYSQAQTEYAESTMPFFLIETVYENPTPLFPSNPYANEAQVRSQAYQALLSGAFGQFMGNNPIWYFCANGGSGCDWVSAMTSPGAQSMTHLHDLMASLSWWRLAPDSSLVASGQSSGTGYSPGATASDGSFALVYFPAGQALGINLSHLAGPHVKARWYDPSSGAFSSVSGSPFSPSGAHTFTPPGANADSYADWILLLQSVQ